MAIEARRGCGYRKVNGLYLCADAPGASCCKLPITLHVCPTCGGGIKQNRSWQWIDPKPWLKADCTRTGFMRAACPLANPEQFGDKVGLLWVGEQFYKSPADFLLEANRMGVSRRIKAVPRGFHLGEHWVFFAHPKVTRIVDAETGETTWAGGIFQVTKPNRIERICTESQRGDEELLAKLADEGITPVFVPDDDHDHRGSPYDKRRDDDDPELPLDAANPEPETAPAL